MSVFVSLIDLYPHIVGALSVQQYDIQCRQLGSLHYIEWEDSDMEAYTCCQHYLKWKPSGHYQGKLLSFVPLYMHGISDIKLSVCYKKVQ